MKKTIAFSLFMLAIYGSCQSSHITKNEIKVELTSKSDSKVTGTAIFSEKNGIITMVANMNGLTPGEHAIHLHEKADCSAPDGTSTGGHWNPTFKKHGKWGQAEYHRGDIGNFTADANGNAVVNFATDEWCIGCGDPARDITGKGLIIHKGVDDFTTQPTGNAGGRIACAGILK
ncbi:superoxide dismutase family protein [Flavobacterium oreochromis]|uniref:Superoxide dismutase [Cu-Zn] n=2 Tax=Flavobacterium TaxID=237 RepID=A0A246G9I1_9FLAO|nr:superoxide dismutase family protein [Flavobacterium oreochromis]OWP76233.1 superoxide dismutase [Flavobacterium oreochromis]OWP76915.1 superoxide dismutase [Flavobacterium oreochromis]POR17636.1 superoxide dismutase [Flavobacterium columnare]QYS86046.1 superoxide dismutase family protein [Flavobacterium oreochromis]